MIKIFALDIDGVITNGTLTLDYQGNEYKTISYIDIDALTLLQRNQVKIALITGESGPLVDVIARKLNADVTYPNSKDKKSKILELVSNFNVLAEQISFIGDTERDAEALMMLEHSFAPSNADKYAKEAANHTLTNSGGNGAVNEVVQMLIRNKMIIIKEK